MSQDNGDGGRIRAVFYYRVGSGFRRDQDATINLQAARIAATARRLNLKVVGIYTDFAVTRSTPWPARPAARTLAQRLTERAVFADVVIVEDPRHAIGPDNITAALKAIPIPLCTPREGLHPVIADHPGSAITGRMSEPPRPARRARRFPCTARRR